MQSYTIKEAIAAYNSSLREGTIRERYHKKKDILDIKSLHPNKLIFLESDLKKLGLYPEDTRITVEEIIQSTEIQEYGSLKKYPIIDFLKSTPDGYNYGWTSTNSKSLLLKYLEENIKDLGYTPAPKKIKGISRQAYIPKLKKMGGRKYLLGGAFVPATFIKYLEEKQKVTLEF